MLLDRFSWGRKDPQEIEPIKWCEGCGQAIYEGDMIYELYNGITHADDFCLRLYLDPVKKEIRGINNGI